MICFLLLAAALADDLNLIPTPQYCEPLKAGVTLSGARAVRIAVGEKPEPKVELAAKMIRDEFELREPRLKGKIEIGKGPHAEALTIDLAGAPDLSDVDRSVLSHASEQSYVLRTAFPASVWIAGRPQGALYGAATLLQLARETPEGLHIPGVYIRDFPHFEYRAAADWLLLAECDRWCMDRGQGIAGFEALCRRKLDLCLRYKINMVTFDGFGWGLRTRFPEYPALMRRLNAFARERGIHLVFGGYGANYEVASRSEALYNRESYPDGPVYSCMAHSNEKREEKKELFRGVRGTCRGNDELNRLKARQLEEYVRAVEPGALYIHHEDYGGTDSTAAVWVNRDERCRKRWPSDDLTAADGGAGAMAHGYSALVNAVNGVRNDETGYVALRDCRIILVSPVYMPSSSSSENWSRALRLWQNIGKLLPRAPNLMTCFRETFPQEPGGARWSEAFTAAMRDAGVDLGLWLFLCGGGDRYVNDYPLVATPVMNTHFLGARGVFNFSGDGYQEPQQLLNAEYDWNVASRGFFRDAKTHVEARRVYWELANQQVAPEEIFGDRGFLVRACERLYGKSAAGAMVRYYRENRPLPVEGGRERKTLPSKDERIHAVPVFGERLIRDASTWKSRDAALHARLKRYWETVLQVTERGEGLLREALGAGPSTSSRADLEFLLVSTRVAVPLCQALVDFHGALSEPDGAGSALDRAQDRAEQAAARAREAFPTVVDPAGAEVGILRKQLEALREEIRRRRP